MKRASSQAASTTEVDARPEDHCPFCQIVTGRAPAQFIAKLTNVIAIIPLDPCVDGHVLFIPRLHVTRDDFLEVSHSPTAFMWMAAWQYAITRRKPYNLIINVGVEATQTVDHLHLHYIPRAPGDDLVLPWTAPSTEEAL